LKEQVKSLEKIMEQNFLEYASYVIIDRAIPDIRDGLKPVQRRILYTMWKMEDGKYHKVANTIGETMKLHPHGDASIGDALVVIANKELFIDKQGNFGNISTGHSAAAPRYIECRLTELAKETLFAKAALTEFKLSYDGRNQEPVALQSKLPMALLLGVEGIAVGMSTKILPHNFNELLQAQINILEGKEFILYPDFHSGGIMDISEYDDGNGKVKVRAKIKQIDEKTIVIEEIPFGTTTESIIGSIESAIKKGTVKISNINDFTTDHVEIELSLPRGVYSDEVIPQLYANTDCEIAIHSNIVVIKEQHPIIIKVSDTLLYMTTNLCNIIYEELALELSELNSKKHWMSIERLFIEKKIYKLLEKASSEEKAKIEIKEAFIQESIEVIDEDIKKLLEIPIRRISKFDSSKSDAVLKELEKAVKGIESKLNNIKITAIDYLKYLLKKYGELYPRKTRIETIEAINFVAQKNIKLSYDADSGFFGSSVKSESYQMMVSEYDRILIVTKDGKFRVIGPEEKFLIQEKIVYLGLFDQDNGHKFTLIYHNKDKIAFGKKVHIQKFVRDREYSFVPEDCKFDYIWSCEQNGMVILEYMPKRGQRIAEGKVKLAELDFMGLNARGTKLSPKQIQKVKYLKE
jgi:topoisomerase-4 subunit A